MGDYAGQSVASLVAKSQLPTPLPKNTNNSSFWVPYNVLVAQYMRLGCMRGCANVPVFAHACVCASACTHVCVLSTIYPLQR